MTDLCWTATGVRLDEAHELMLTADILLGLLQQIAKKRSDLKIVVINATLVADKFQAYFDKTIPEHSWSARGDLTPEPEKENLETTILTVVQIHRCERERQRAVLPHRTGID